MLRSDLQAFFGSDHGFRVMLEAVQQSQIACCSAESAILGVDVYTHQAKLRTELQSLSEMSPHSQIAC